MHLFSRSKDVVPAKIELVSVHIPKTAGTSFRHLLKDVFGEQAVVRLDIPLLDPRPRLNEQLTTEDRLPENTRVVHGHFNPVELRQRFPETVTSPMITWLRHPVERVISNYSYLAKRLKEELREEQKDLNILIKMQRSLLEYARDEINCNRQSKFLAGMPLTDFAFVGIQEHYDEEVASLAKNFHWSSEIAAPTHNVTGKKKEVSEEDWSAIAQLNAEDVNLYEAALKLRKNRIGPPKIELISIHIPKTGGTSFYQSLLTNYGNVVSFPFRRKKLERCMKQYGSILGSLNGNKQVIHGHLHYSEIADIHKDQEAKVICWLRDPVERVISNYHFFKAGLTDPNRNRRNYRLNKHRKKESLLTYANREENQNVMSRFLAGIEIEDLFFIGFLENYRKDLERLGQLLGWPTAKVTQLNEGKKDTKRSSVDDAVLQEIEKLNEADVQLYNRARQLNNHEGV